jgi:uncharacterized membrane protein (DUF106 family)
LARGLTGLCSMSRINSVTVDRNQLYEVQSQLHETKEKRLLLTTSSNLL